MKKKYNKVAIVFLTTLLFFNDLSAQEVKVMTLGTFHFRFPNNDLIKTSDSKKIDVLDSLYQIEIQEITNKLKEFHPTIIAVEREPEQQKRIDSLYQKYLNGEHNLSRDEVQQLGFRLAKQLNLNKVYCIDANARFYKDIDSLFKNKKSNGYKRFNDFFYNNPDFEKAQALQPENIINEQGITDKLKSLNQKENVIKSLGSYTLGIFKYKTEKNKHFGADFTSGWWFNRNLRIFRNIQNLNASTNDRILIIIGAGHLNLLNPLLEASPEYRLINTNDYLK